MSQRGFNQNSLYLLTLAVAIYFFLVMGGVFSDWVDLWSLLAGGLMVFLILALWSDPLFSQLIYGDFRDKTWRALALGVGSALLLYGVFFAGNIFLKKFFPASGEHLTAIYNLKFGSHQLRISLFLALIIGPGEELLWRGWLQRHWSAALGPLGGWLGVSLLYGLVHLPSRNPVLVLAALVCGLWWGFQYHKFNSLLSNVVSHALWDLLVFIILPFS
ncbi:MAG: lysostaphin resistance A-like protein [Candidatus Saccharicenans sp.]|uniref:lysostaphin resistance A-like protein n=1 Tax=Candidatus Saccharicenans sp. TaxID=2819258 RepID=UPI00404991A7